MLAKYWALAQNRRNRNPKSPRICGAFWNQKPCLSSPQSTWKPKDQGFPAGAERLHGSARLAGIWLPAACFTSKNQKRTRVVKTLSRQSFSLGSLWIQGSGSFWGRASAGLEVSSHPIHPPSGPSGILQTGHVRTLNHGPHSVSRRVLTFRAKFLSGCAAYKYSVILGVDVEMACQGPPTVAFGLGRHCKGASSVANKTPQWLPSQSQNPLPLTI